MNRKNDACGFLSQHPWIICAVCKLGLLVGRTLGWIRKVPQIPRLGKLAIRDGTNSRAPRFGMTNWRDWNNGVSNMLSTVLIVVVILLLVGALPNWGYSRNWGYGPSGGLGLVFVILLILLLLGRI